MRLHFLTSSGSSGHRNEIPKTVLDTKNPNNYLTTHCKNERRIQSHLVTKNLTLHRMSKTEFQPDPFIRQMLSFQNMPNTMGSKMNSLAVRDFFSQKCLKTVFLSDTNHDHLTLEGHNSLIFKDFFSFSGVYLKI